MAKFAATDYVIKINGNDFSTNMNQAELTIEAEDLETTAFGQGFRTRIGGLKQASVTLQFMQDFAGGSIDATLNSLVGTIATVVLIPAGTAISATNPSYTANCLVTQYSPMASSVGDLATFSITWPVSGTVTRGTTA
jgi:hypothetical protein